MAELGRELGSGYPAELFDDALAEIKKLDKTWTVEARAVKAQYAAALTRRDEAQADADRIKEKSSERSRLSQELRAELARSAFELVVNNPDLSDRRAQAIRLQIQHEVGLWINERDVRNLAKTVERLDGAVAGNDLIMHFEKGNMDYVAQPKDDETMLYVDFGKGGHLHDITVAIPYQTMVGRSDRDRYWSEGPGGALVVHEDGAKDLAYDLMTEDSEKKYREDGKYGTITTYKDTPLIKGAYLPYEHNHAFVVGAKAIKKTIDTMIDTPPPEPSGNERPKDGPFTVWWAASIVSGDFTAYEETFRGDITAAVTRYLDRQLSGYGPNRDDIVPESIAPLLNAAKRLGLGPDIVRSLSANREVKGVLRYLSTLGQIESSLVAVI